jgi:F-type H+-transporting ATPase subunit delta
MAAAPADASVRIADELEQVAGLEAEAPEAWTALTAPGVPTGTRKAALDAMLTDAHPLTRNLLKLLVDNGRLAEINAVAAAVRALVSERDKQLDVHVTSAVELSSDLRTRIEQRLSTSTGSQVRLHASVDPAIIGGLVVRHGDTLIDTSLRGRLEQLKLALSRPALRPPSASTTADSQ